MSSFSHDQTYSFLADAMFGKLGTFLRILGYDTEIASNVLRDEQILEHVKMSHRVLLTRDKQFHTKCEEEGVPSVYLPSQDLSELLYLLDKKGYIDLTLCFRLLCKESQMISRCSVCNSELVPVKKETIKPLVPSGTYEKHEQFWICNNSSCGKIFWRGSHLTNICSVLESSLNLYGGKESL